VIPEFVAARGEIVSLFAVAIALAAATGPLARVSGLERGRLGDLLWNGGVAFVVVGRLAELALESPRTLLDPLVLIRIQGGVEPLAGAAAVAAVAWWHARRAPADRDAWALVAAAALALAVAGYDLACVVRDACYGTAAPAPLGFRMSRLADTRLATPLVEATVLLLALALLLAALRRLPARALAAWTLAAVALLRAALTPASIAGRDSIGAETAVLVVIGVAAAAAGAWWARPGTPAAGPALPPGPAPSRSPT